MGLHRSVPIIYYSLSKTHYLLPYELLDPLKISCLLSLVSNGNHISCSMDQDLEANAQYQQPEHQNLE
jgi:hypothetical protein